MQNTPLLIEWIILFILVPLGLCIELPWWSKAIVVLASIAYVIYISFQKSIHKPVSTKVSWANQKYIWLRFGLFALASTSYMYLFQPDLFFKVPLTNPLLWLFILFVYTILSVLPQEWLYRHFYIQRYGELFQNKSWMHFANAAVFSLAHLFLFNSLVLILTFFGGLLFFDTYKKSGSFNLVCAEHAAYGLWIFTIGAGEMLAFPM